MKNKIIYTLLIIVALIITTGCNNKYDIWKGIWIASIENQRVYEEDNVGGIEDYYLKCNGKGLYDLTSNSGDLANARYKISNNVVTFYDEGREILAICKIKEDVLDCTEKSYYAVKYIKVNE